MNLWKMVMREMGAMYDPGVLCMLTLLWLFSPCLYSLGLCGGFVCVCVCVFFGGNGVFLNQIYINFICVVPAFSCSLHFVVVFLWKQKGEDSGCMWACQKVEI